MQLTIPPGQHPPMPPAEIPEARQDREKTASSYDELACDIRRLFRLAIAGTTGGVVDAGRIILCAERILDTTGLLALRAEPMGEQQKGQFAYSIDQCEAEAQRLFDACVGGRSAAVLSAYAERGLISSYGLQQMFMSVSH